MVQSVQIELSINTSTTRSQIQINAYVTGISEICPMIQRLDSCNLLTDKVTKKVP